jgi:hypothetical protein
MNEQPARRDIMIIVASNGSHRPGVHRPYHSSPATRINREISDVISAHSADKLIALPRIARKGHKFTVASIVNRRAG